MRTMQDFIAVLLAMIWYTLITQWHNHLKEKFFGSDFQVTVA